MPNPTPRRLLTALINRISSIPLLDEPPPSKPIDIKDGDHDNNGLTPSTGTTTNPLRRVPISHRHLLITLHVLFPGMVLPALDLLDRKLVTRLVLDPALSWSAFKPKDEPVKKEGERSPTEPEPTPEAAERESDDDDHRSKKEETKKRQAEIYVVYSASIQQRQQRQQQQQLQQLQQLQNPRRKPKALGEETVSGPGQKYIVSLRAWNCTCAAFAFAAIQHVVLNNKDTAPIPKDIPPPPPPPPPRSSQQQEEGDVSNYDYNDNWSFGGLSLTGLLVDSDSTPTTATPKDREGEDEEETGGVPICKHLLACLLAERWSNALGEYVVEKRVGREEMAGVVADI
ncbi:hypothetical protein QBC44DRAFT_355033 [Cladorrhinum sp. PSN332]|nr:hypothetical protein QBC44DRAFT_355033 [Cladorrhinum sp. PSN332]